MNGDLRIGVKFESDWDPAGLPDFARWVERAGYDELWFSEDLPWSGGIAMAAIVLVSTERLRVGIGLLPALTRNVATAAMEVAVLERVAPGRTIVALGHGYPPWMEQIGITTASSLNALEETTVALRSLLDGEELTTAGQDVRLDAVRLGFPPAGRTPILLGTTGPRGLGLAGRVADGVMLPSLATPDAVRWAGEKMERAAATSVVEAFLALEDDREDALAQVRARIERLIAYQAFPKLTEIAGLRTDGSGELTDDVIQAMALAGTPGESMETVRNLASAGADSIVLVAGAAAGKRHYERFAEEVLPLVQTTAEVATNEL